MRPEVYTILGCIVAAAALYSCGGEKLGPSPQDPVAYDETKAVHKHFSGERALEHTANVVEFGPRPPGTEALEKTRVYIEQELDKLGWEVKRQTFTDSTPIGDVEFVNVRARYRGDGEIDWDSSVAVLLGGHYDTKYYENMVFVGANDAGSSTGGLIEAGAALAKNPEVAKRVELVFFDGEECYVAYTETDGLFGSRYYKSQLQKRGVKSFPGALVILDMIADRDLLIGFPKNCSAELIKRAAFAAVDLGHQAHFFPDTRDIIDDHVPFNQLRIPTVNFIDYDYTPWHTSRDTMDKLSARSMERVGQVALLLIEKYVLPDPVNPKKDG